MRILVIYDISQNHKRDHVIKILQHYGLHRIQKSGFLGNLNTEKENELINLLEILDYGEKDSLYIFPICKKCRSQVKVFPGGNTLFEDIKPFKIV